MCKHQFKSLVSVFTHLKSLSTSDRSVGLTTYDAVVLKCSYEQPEERKKKTQKTRSIHRVVHWKKSHLPHYTEETETLKRFRRTAVSEGKWYLAHSLLTHNTHSGFSHWRQLGFFTIITPMNTCNLLLQCQLNKSQTMSMKSKNN